MTDIRKYIQLIEQIQINEGRQDTLFSEAISALKKLTDELEIDINQNLSVLVDGYNNIKKGINTNINNTWKVYFAQFSIAQIYMYFTITTNLSSSVKFMASTKKKSASIKDDKSLLYIGTDVHHCLARMKEIQEELNHFYGINYSKIQTLNPEKTNGFISQLKELEITYKNLIRTNIIPTGVEEPIVVFNDGYTWFNLHKVSCGVEGDAMGHCGNTGNPKDGDTVLSLRKVENIDGLEIHIPVLTFILNNGYLGEMKGKGNDKPSKKYHRYIVELLKHESIKGIKGGGYLPENNFSLYDLPDSTIAELIKLKGEDFDLSPKTILYIAKKYDDGQVSATNLVKKLDNLQKILDTKVEFNFMVDGDVLIWDIENIVPKYNGDIFKDKFEDKTIKHINEDIGDYICKHMRSVISNSDKDTLVKYYSNKYPTYFKNENPQLNNIADIFQDANDIKTEKYKDTYALVSKLIDMNIEACRITSNMEYKKFLLENITEIMQKFGITVKDIDTTVYTITKGNAFDIFSRIVDNYPAFRELTVADILYDMSRMPVPNKAYVIDNLGNIFKHYENIELSGEIEDPETALEYLTSSVNYNKIPEKNIKRMEEKFANYPHLSNRYVEHIKKPFPLGEEKIKENPEELYYYIRTLYNNGYDISHLEKHLFAFTDSTYLMNYAVLVNKPLPKSIQDNFFFGGENRESIYGVKLKYITSVDGVITDKDISKQLSYSSIKYFYNDNGEKDNIIDILVTNCGADSLYSFVTEYMDELSVEAKNKIETAIIESKEIDTIFYFIRDVSKQKSIEFENLLLQSNNDRRYIYIIRYLHLCYKIFKERASTELEKYIFSLYTSTNGEIPGISYTALGEVAETIESYAKTFGLKIKAN